MRMSGNRVHFNPADWNHNSNKERIKEYCTAADQTEYDPLQHKALQSIKAIAVKRSETKKCLRIDIIRWIM